MPAIQNSKRTAITEERGSEKKLKLTAIAEAIERSEELPQAVKEMLVEAVPGSLGVPADERHEFQTEMVTVIGKLISNIQEKLEQEHDAAKAAVAEVENMKAGLDANAEVAKARASEAENEKKTKKNALAEAMQQLVAKQSTRQEAEAAQQKDTRILEKIGKERVQVETCMEQHLKPLLDGTVEDGQAAEHCKGLESILLKLDLEESLATALNSALTKKPSDRGDFDVMVVEGLQKAFDEKKAALASSLEASSTTVSQRAAAAASEEEAWKALRTMLKASADEYTSAETASKDAETAKKTALGELRGHSARLGEAEVECDEKNATLTAFISHNMTSFEVLRDGKKMEEPLEEAAEAAPAVVAGGGA